MTIPVAVVEAIIVLVAKYGPELAINIINLLKKKEITIEEIELLFANVKKYEDYGIPEIVTPS